MKRKQVIKGIILYPILCIIGIVAITPLFVLFQLAFSTQEELAKEGFWQVPSMTLENISAAWEKADMTQALINSVTITACGVVLTVFIACSAAYFIARFSDRFTDIVYQVFVFSMAIPTIVATVPLYIIMRSLNAINSLWGIILLLVTTSLPFAIFLYTGFIRSIPTDIEDAAKIDGCSNWGILWRIIFPILTPVTVTVVLLNTVYFWNEYGRTVFFLQKRELYTVPLAISTFIQQYSTSWGLMAGGAFVAVIPVIVLFLLLQKYYIKGISGGAVKG